VAAWHSYTECIIAAGGTVVCLSSVYDKPGWYHRETNNVGYFVTSTFVW